MSEALEEFASLTPEQKRALTVAARRRRTGFQVGQEVRVIAPRSPRFDGRKGVVTGINLGEVGVGLTSKTNADAWFLPAELESVAE